MAAALLAAAAAQAELVDRVAAVVNKDIIALSEVEQRASPELAKIAGEPSPQVRGKLRQEVIHRTLEQLIGEKLMDQQIRDQNLEVTESELDAAVEDVKRNNNMDGAHFEQVLRNEGYTVASYREFMRKHLAKLKLVNLKVRNRIKISDDDLKAEYQRYQRAEGEDPEIRARHILVKLSPKPTPEEVDKARRRAEALAQKARQPGTDFAELAKKQSDGPSAPDGGDLGYFKRGVMLPEFEQVAFDLKPGAVSQPVRSKFGWHVIKVEDRRAQAPKSFEEVKEQLREKLLREKMETYTDRYVQELRQNAVVEEKI